MQEEFNLNTVHMGLLQSSILVGYVFGQVSYMQPSQLACKQPVPQHCLEGLAWLKRCHALIWLYHRGIQVPAGFVADRIGGPNVMLAGLALWSCFTGLMPLARAAPPSQQLLVLMLLRALLGLSQSVILPSTSAAVSRYGGAEPELACWHVACCGLQY